MQPKRTPGDGKQFSVEYFPRYSTLPGYRPLDPWDQWLVDPSKFASVFIDPRDSSGFPPLPSPPGEQPDGSSPGEDSEDAEGGRS